MVVLNNIHGQLGKVFFRDKEFKREAAGIAFAFRESGTEYTSEIHSRLNRILPEDSPHARFYGSIRFDESQIVSTEWDAFHGYTFVLPLVEYQRFAESEESALDTSASHRALLALNIPTKACRQRSQAVKILETVEHVLAQLGQTELLYDLNRDPSKVNGDIEHGAEVDSASMIKSHTDKKWSAESVQEKLIMTTEVENTMRDYDHWCRSIGTIQDSISNRKYSKVVLARRKEFMVPENSPVDPTDILWNLDSSLKKGYLFCLQLDEKNAFVGCSPERLFKLSSGKIETEAVAGTISVDKGSEEVAEKSLLSSHKDSHEHNFVVQYIQQILLETLPGLKLEKQGPMLLKLPHLMHIRTLLSGSFSFNKESDQRDSRLATIVYRLLRKLHPTPAVCGLPMMEAKGEIKTLENFDRGLYAGPFGTFSRDTAEFCVAIRSGLVKSDRIYMYAGAGIVEASNARSEWDEVDLKFSTFRKAVGAFRETARFKLESASNLNELWGVALIEELCRNGVDHFFVAPGSRSSPLAIGVVRCANAKFISCHDERGAAFMALGYARGCHCAAAVITSSGTAVANLLPAVVEASQDDIPLILLTADRPPELRYTGANQTIDQVKIFGNYVKWFQDMPCPDSKIPIRKLLGDVDFAVSVAHRQGDSGPVHLNMMFRESLAPIEEPWPKAEMIDNGIRSWEISGRPWCRYYGSFSPEVLLDPNTKDMIRFAKRGMIVVGNLGTQPDLDRKAALRLARLLRWPVVPDILSGLRTTFDNSQMIEDDTEERHDVHLVHYTDQLLLSKTINDQLEPDCVILLGHRVISKRVLSLLVQKTGSLIAVSEAVTRRFDEQYRVTQKYTVPVHSFVDAVERFGQQEKVEFVESGLSFLVEKSHRVQEFLNRHFDQVESGMDPKGMVRRASSDGNGHESNAIEAQVSTLTSLSEPGCARAILQHCATFECSLFVSNSMPIRDLDMFGGLCGQINIACNRGASGIDGILSSGIGFAIGCRRPTYILIGDVAFLHDLNALHTLKSLASVNTAYTMSCPPISIVVLNNYGGGIFQFLPIARYADLVNPLFTTPHDVGFQHAAGMFGLQYCCPGTSEELQNCLHDSHDNQKTAGMKDKLTDFQSFHPSTNSVLCNGSREKAEVLISTNLHRIIEVRSDQTVNVTLHKFLNESIVDMLEGKGPG